MLAGKLNFACVGCAFLSQHSRQSWLGKFDIEGTKTATGSVVIIVDLRLQKTIKPRIRSLLEQNDDLFILNFPRLS